MGPGMNLTVRLSSRICSFSWFIFHHVSLFLATIHILYNTEGRKNDDVRHIYFLKSSLASPLLQTPFLTPNENPRICHDSFVRTQPSSPQAASRPTSSPPPQTSSNPHHPPPPLAHYSNPPESALRALHSVHPHPHPPLPPLSSLLSSRRAPSRPRHNY